MKRLLTLLIPILLIILVATQWQRVADWYVLRGYTPSPAIEEIAKNTTMTPLAQRYFYTARAQLDQKTEFNQNCPTGELTQVLGCYTQRRIYILDVDRPELEKVEDVTGAHEMLHAAYARLASRERKEVDAQIKTFYQNLNDQKIKDLIERYEQTEPGETLNELHSILPTQVAELSPWLENYYKKYFVNRDAIVTSYKQYEGVFDNIQAQYSQLKSEIEYLKSQIENAKQEYESAAAEADRLSEQISTLRAQGNIAGSNSLVAAQNAAVAKANLLAAQIRRLVTNYNNDVDILNQLALRQNELVQSLNSSELAPAR